MDQSIFAGNVRHLREVVKKVNQAEMAAMIGVSMQTWNNYERMVSRPKLEDLIKISKLFNITETDLLHTELQESDLKAAHLRYEKHLNSDLNSGLYTDLNGKKSPKKYQVNEDQSGYNRGNRLPTEIALLLIEKDKTIQAQATTIKALQAALLHAEARLHPHPPPGKK